MMKEYYKAKGSSNLTIIEWADKLHNPATYPFEREFLHQLLQVLGITTLFIIVITVAGYFLLR